MTKQSKAELESGLVYWLKAGQNPKFVIASRFEPKNWKKFYITDNSSGQPAWFKPKTFSKPEQYNPTPTSDSKQPPARFSDLKVNVRRENLVVQLSQLPISLWSFRQSVSLILRGELWKNCLPQLKCSACMHIWRMKIHNCLSGRCSSCRLEFSAIICSERN